MRNVIFRKAIRPILLAFAALALGSTVTVSAQTVTEEVIWSTTGSTAAVDEGDLATYELELQKGKTIGGDDTYSPFTGGPSTAPAGTKVEYYYRVEGGDEFKCAPAPATCKFRVMYTYKATTPSNGRLQVLLYRYDTQPVVGSVYTMGVHTPPFNGLSSNGVTSLSTSLNLDSDLFPTSGSKPATVKTYAVSTSFDFSRYSFFFQAILEKRTAASPNVELSSIKIIKETTTP